MSSAVSAWPPDDLQRGHRVACVHVHAPQHPTGLAVDGDEVSTDSTDHRNGATNGDGTTDTARGLVRMSSYRELIRSQGLGVVRT